MRSIAIREIRARQILDCKGKPMLEVDVLTEGGALGRASSPSGVSAGEHEAYVLRDQNPDFLVVLAFTNVLKLWKMSLRLL